MAEKNTLQNTADTIKRGIDNANAMALRAIGNAIAPIIGGQIGDLLGRNARNIAQAFGAFLVAQAVAGFILTVAVATAMLVFAAFAMFIINSGAYIVAPGSIFSDEFGGGTGSLPGGSIPGGVVSDCPNDGEITAQLAARINGGTVRLLPDFLEVRSTNRYCIEPTMMVMHWSAGSNDNPSGNDATYNTLVSRGLACQLGTDTNNVELWQSFYPDVVERSWCVGAWNDFSINNEMAGIAFTANPPPPNLAELELAYGATCTLMQQYGIPWCQVFGHLDAPYNGGKTDPGRDFLYNVFVPEIKRRCPNDFNSSCPGAPTGLPPEDPGGPGPF